MKREDYDKVVEQLQKEYDLNKEKINELEYKLEILRHNGIVNPKTIFSTFLALLVYFGVLTLATFIPPVANITTEICLVVSALTGLITSKKLEKKYKYKAKLREFSTAKKQVDMLEETIKYQLEKEKLKNKNEILAATIDDLDINLRSVYVLKENHCWVKQERVFSDDKLKKGIDVIESQINVMNNILNVKVAQKLLKSEISNNKVNTEVRIFFAIVASMCSMFVYLLPSMLMGFSGGIIRFVIGLIVGIVGGFTFDNIFHKFVQDKQQVLKKYNQELGENAISDEFDSEKEKINELELIPLRHYISSMMVRLEDMKSQLNVQESESFTSDNKTPKQNIVEYEVEDNVLAEEKGIQFTKRRNNDNRH